MLVGILQRYHWFRQYGLFTGSGVVEAGYRTVTGQLLKLSGTHWTPAGADAITTLTCQQARRPDLDPPPNQTPAS